MNVLIVGIAPDSLIEQLQESNHQVNQTNDRRNDPFIAPIYLERDPDLVLVIINISLSRTEAVVSAIRDRFAERRIIIVTHNGTPNDMPPQIIKHSPEICTMRELGARLDTHASEIADCSTCLQMLGRQVPV